jgi:hypothetical protein
MTRATILSIIASLGTASAAIAEPVLQFDVNQFAVQAFSSAGVASPFGGLTHTGSVRFTTGQGILNGIFIQTTPSGPFTNAGFDGSTLTTFGGRIDFTNGVVTGGNLIHRISNNDQYICNITPESGTISTFVGGGYKIEGLSRTGLFNDAQFGNVNVSPWFNSQGLAGLLGSFLQFNFNPNAQGAANSDMDYFVAANSTVVPLPPAAWAGLATMAGFIAFKRYRNR